MPLTNEDIATSTRNPFYVHSPNPSQNVHLTARCFGSINRWQTFHTPLRSQRIRLLISLLRRHFHNHQWLITCCPPITPPPNQPSACYYKVYRITSVHCVGQTIATMFARISTSYTSISCKFLAKVKSSSCACPLFSLGIRESRTIQRFTH